MTKQLMKKILNPETNEGINEQFEILLVPGGMIVYRNKWITTNTRQTATFVPLENVNTSIIKNWLYGDLVK